MTNARLGLGLLLSGAFLASAASAAPTATPAPALPPVVKVPVKPEIIGFNRVLPPSGAALTDGPLHLRVHIRNPSGTQISKQVNVTRMPGTPQASSVGSFMVDIPANGTTPLGFSDAKSINDGCNPTRYQIAVEGGVTRVGNVKPSCTFTFTKTPSSSGPQGTLATNPACNQPWNLSATVTPPMPMPGPPAANRPTKMLALRSSPATIIGSQLVEASTMPANPVITAPFLGPQGTLFLTYTDRPLPGLPAIANIDNAWTVRVDRTCTVDGGTLE